MEPGTTGIPPTPSDLIGLVAVLRVVRENATSFAVIILGVTVASTLASFLLHSWYRSGAEFTVESGPIASSSAGVLGLASQLGLAGLPGGAPTISYYEEVLSSDPVLDPVALGALPMDSSGQIDNIFRGKSDTLTTSDKAKARRKLKDHFSTATNGRANTVSFWIEARTPYSARAAADSILASLNRAIIALRRRHATAERVFLESRLDTARQNETRAEDSLRTFYMQNRVLSAPSLQFTEARLKRRVDFALQLSGQLETQVEQARLQEVHDTPVLSIISPPDVP